MHEACVPDVPSPSPTALGPPPLPLRGRGRGCYFTTRLFAAGSRHVLQVNDEIEPGQGFRGKDGQWLVPREWRFTVEAAEGE